MPEPERLKKFPLITQEQSDMPELPEVETVKRGLEPSFTHAKIINVKQNRPDLRFPFR